MAIGDGNFLALLGDYTKDSLNKLGIRNILDIVFESEREKIKEEKGEGEKYALELSERIENRIINEYLQDLWQIDEFNPLYRIIRMFLSFYFNPYRFSENKVSFFIENDIVMENIIEILDHFGTYIGYVQKDWKTMFEIKILKNKITVFKIG